jgi:3-hydroxyacyl-CoA dehydrogenase/enoyl-CoA hydratase/3-hydroxybutyryl-CoA epimerase
MPLLEVIVTDQTAPWVTVSAVAFGRRMGKTVVVVRDRPGFWVNRLLAPYLNEAGALIAEGVAFDAIDRVAVDFGFPVGPITLMDEIGLDVIHKAAGVMHQAYGDRLTPSPGIGLLVAAGRLGRKSGAGFFRYAGGKKRGPDPRARAAFASGRGGMPAAAIQERLIAALLNEAALALEDDVVRSPRDGDIAAVFGFGFPPFRGGPLRHIDDLGAGAVVELLERLTRTCGPRFTPAPLLRRAATSGQPLRPLSR